MPQVVASNIFSLNAQRNLNRNSSELQTTIQRLSSGLRINSAKDDAAGLAIAARMTTQVNGLGVAIRNANDGISIAQTAEGAMDEIGRSLTRASDLALQAASFNSDADRGSLNQEVRQIVDEISRVVNQTRFNGQKLLAGGFTANIQVGTQVNESLNISVGNLSASNLGVASSYSAVNALSDANFADRIRNASATALASTDTVNGVQLGTTINAGTNSQTRAAALNAITAQTGVSAFTIGNAASSASDITDANLTAATDIGANGLIVNGVSFSGSFAGANGLRDALNARSNETGVTAVVDAGAGANQSRLVLLNRTGAAISVTASSANAATISGFAVGNTQMDAGANGAMVLSQNLNSTTVTFGTATVGEGLTGVNGATATLTNESLQNAAISTTAGANLALLTFSRALDQVNSERSLLGARQNRFESTVRNLENVRENISAARSRIQDADFAEETAKLTRTQILQQAGTAMVSQANSLPQAALSLLQ